VRTLETAIVLADMQIPFQATPAIEGVLHYIYDEQPDMVVLLGDILDFPQLTTKFLRTRTDPNLLLEDIDTARGYIKHIETLAPEARIIYVAGNHEERLRKYVLECAPAFEALIGTGKALDLPTMLDCKKLEYYGPYSEPFIYNSFVFKHGDRTTTYAAAAELRAEGTSGMSGHTHRSQMASHTDRSGAHAWYSVGCLCNVSGSDMPPGYRGGEHVLRDQQQGFAVIRFGTHIEVVEDVDIEGRSITERKTHRNMFQVIPINITDDKFFDPSGILYGPEGALL